MTIGTRTQHQHLIRLNTVLGDKALFVNRLDATLAMSAETIFSLTVYSDEFHGIEPRELIGTPATIAVIDEHGEPLYYNSYITGFHKGDPAGTGQASEYLLTVKPWLSFLAHDSDNRVFQNSSVTDVIQQILQPYRNLGKFELNLGKRYPKKPYLVQYNETNLNFFHRGLVG